MTNSRSRVSEEKPLSGASFCCTAIAPEERDQLAQWVEEMGATTELDLTDGCTHLLVGPMSGIQRSEKYDFVAREREDIKVLTSEFVIAIRELWMNDQPINMNALEAQHRPPLFHGLITCFTGFADPVYRQKFTEELAQNGAQVSGDLTRQVTHLICNAPRGDKYEYALSWGLIVVSHAWYKDSLARGMLLDESKYHPATPPEQQGAGSWLRRRSGNSSIGKRSLPEQPAEKQKRKLRRTASTKFGSQQNEMLSEIVAAQKVVPVVEKPQIQVARSFAQTVDGSDATKEQQQTPAASHASQLPPEQFTSGIFEGKHFTTKGFDQSRTGILAHHIAGNGGTMHAGLAELCREARSKSDSCFVIVPYTIDAEHLRPCRDWIKNKGADIPFATEFWLEHCINNVVFVLPDNYPLGLPVLKLHEPKISELVVNATGFTSLEVTHIEKVVNKLGARYSDNFDVNVNLLMWKSTNINWVKVDIAEEYEMSAVTEQWLWCMIKAERLPTISRFLDYGKNIARPDHLPKRPIAVVQADTDDQSDDSPQASADSDEVLGVDTPMLESARLASIERPRAQHVNESMPLQERHANLETRQPIKKKKKLFQTFDGASSLLRQGVSASKDQMPSGSDADAPILIDEATQNSRVGDGAEQVVEQHSDEGIDVNSGVDQSEESLPISGLTGVTVDTSSTTEQAKEDLRAAHDRTRTNLMRDFFEIKEAAAKRAAAEENARPSSRQSNKKLLSRAISNLSNSSRRSNDAADQPGNIAARRPLSRISSLHSDGLGEPISQFAPKMTVMKQHDDNTRSRGGAHLAALTTFSTSQFPQPPSPTQVARISYGHSEETAALRSNIKARLAQRRLNKAAPDSKNHKTDDMVDQESEEDDEGNSEEDNSDEDIQSIGRELQRAGCTPAAVARNRNDKSFGQNLNRLLDDESLIGGGFRRRTRGRERALQKAFGDDDDDEPGTWGGGVLK